MDFHIGQQIAQLVSEIADAEIMPAFEIGAPENKVCHPIEPAVFGNQIGGVFALQRLHISAEIFRHPHIFFENFALIRCQFVILRCFDKHCAEFGIVHLGAFACGSDHSLIGGNRRKAGKNVLRHRLLIVGFEGQISNVVIHKSQPFYGRMM